jgi:hypothetical protein
MLTTMRDRRRLSSIPSGEHHDFRNTEGECLLRSWLYQSHQRRQRNHRGPVPQPKPSHLSSSRHTEHQISPPTSTGRKLSLVIRIRTGLFWTTFARSRTSRARSWDVAKEDAARAQLCSRSRTCSLRRGGPNIYLLMRACFR